MSKAKDIDGRNEAETTNDSASVGGFDRKSFLQCAGGVFLGAFLGGVGAELANVSAETAEAMPRVGPPLSSGDLQAIDGALGTAEFGTVRAELDSRGLLAVPSKGHVSHSGGQSLVSVPCFPGGRWRSRSGGEFGGISRFSAGLVVGAHFPASSEVTTFDTFRVESGELVTTSVDLRSIMADATGSLVSNQSAANSCTGCLVCLYCLFCGPVIVAQGGDLFSVADLTHLTQASAALRSEL